jgi:integrase
MRGNVYWVRVRIPPAISDQFNGQTHLRESLRTSDEKAARVKYPDTFARLKRQIEIARRDSNGVLKGKGRKTEDEAAALYFKKLLQESPDPDLVEDMLDVHLEGLLGRVKAEVDGPDGKLTPVYEGEDRALRFLEGVRGSIPDWAEEAIQDRGLDWDTSYRYRIRRAARHFLEWYRQSSADSPLDAFNRVTPEIARDYIRDLEATKTLAVGTIRAYARGLGAIFEWAIDTRKPNVSGNPFLGAVRRRKGQSDPNQPKPRRDPTDAELATLWNGPASPKVAAVIRLGLLTGARLEEIGKLRVQDVEDDEIVIRSGKTRAAARRVPIHRALAPIVDSLTAGKTPEDFLIDGLRTVQGRRTHGLSQRFTEYRKSVGVGTNANGDRESDVVFHSLRHWFVTQAINSGCIKEHIQAVVGHAPDRGVTTGTYYRGPTKENRRAVVDAIRLPAGCKV